MNKIKSTQPINATEGTEPLTQAPEGWEPNARAINAIKSQQDETIDTESVITATQKALQSVRAKQIVRSAIQAGKLPPKAINVVK